MPTARKILTSGQITTQLATVTGSPTGGTWTPYVNGISAGTVAPNASAATLQTALQTALAGVTVTGSAGGPYTITCPIGVAAVVTVGANALTGGTTPGVTMSGINTTIYTVPASSSVGLGTAVLCNVSTKPIPVTISVVPSGGSADGTHRVLAGYLLAAGDTIRFTEIENSMLDTGATIVVSVPAAGALTYLLTGAVFS